MKSVTQVLKQEQKLYADLPKEQRIKMAREFLRTGKKPVA